VIDVVEVKLKRSKIIKECKEGGYSIVRVEMIYETSEVGYPSKIVITALSWKEKNDWSEPEVSIGECTTFKYSFLPVLIELINKTVDKLKETIASS